MRIFLQFYLLALTSIIQQIYYNLKFLNKYLLCYQNIYSSLSINKGLNDDYKLLLPYYFELKSSPIHPNKNKIWEYKDIKVILKSVYFDFTDIWNGNLF